MLDDRALLVANANQVYLLIFSAVHISVHDYKSVLSLAINDSPELLIPDMNTDLPLLVSLCNSVTLTDKSAHAH